ncbi:glycosyltransferase family A protein [uncultured Parabacteroides sp.]|uniref:glycosyltransferase family A protein n=1 Tax=uncultured Parabacteroides sp. TaxID=512312 RepID=UPI0026020AEE|nr:glycosyltransferase family A protein [uncultured Parabacteroides sp.]
MTVEVLISCMYQKDFSIIQRSNVQTDALIINQCDIEKVEEFQFYNTQGKICHARMISTKERGLSKSRNMAIRYATGDICLFCDDDETLETDYETKISTSFERYPKESILIFKIKHPKKRYSSQTYRIGYFKALRVCSCQIAFRRERIPVSFCEKMGSGTGNGGGEENKFLIDCLKKGFKIRYIPLLIMSVSQTDSIWFHGYDATYWINRGWVAKMIYGKLVAYLYIIYVLTIRSHKIDNTNSWFKKAYWIHKGFFEKR